MRFLSNKEKKELTEKLPKDYSINKKDKLKEENDLIYNDNKKLLIIKQKDNSKEKTYLPHLKSINEKLYKAVYVDRGSIPFLIKGADLMRPGIVEIDDNIEENEIILIKDFEHKKNLAIGFSKYNSKDLKKQEKGKSVIIFHYTGDKYY